MAALLIVEDGTMPEGANSYASVADCDLWQGLRSSEVWPVPPAGSDDPDLSKKESALILAADYLNGLKWVGRRAAPGRLMAWPRIEAVDDDNYTIAADIVPEKVKAACCYLAGLAYGGADLQPVLERGGRIQSESAGSLSMSYFDDADNRDAYTKLIDLLGGLVTGLGVVAGGNGLSVVEMVRG